MRAQVSALDALVSVLLFAGVYSILTAMYAEINLEPDEFEDLALKSRLASFYLLSSSGEPFNWTASNASQLGLVINRGVIETNKLAEFLNLSQRDLNRTRELLGISGLRFYFNLSYINGTAVVVNSSSFNGTAVIGNDFNATPLASTRSLAVYNNQRVFVLMRLAT